MKKKFLVGITAVSATVAMLLASCGAKKSVDVDALSNALLTEITYDCELSKLDEDDISNFMEVSDGVTGVMYMSSGATTEEFAVFTAPNEQTAIEMKDSVSVFLDDQNKSFKDYIPKEAERVSGAVLVQDGNYVVLSVSGDNSAAKEIIDSYLK